MLAGDLCNLWKEVRELEPFIAPFPGFAFLVIFFNRFYWVLLGFIGFY